MIAGTDITRLDDTGADEATAQAHRLRLPVSSTSCPCSTRKRTSSCRCRFSRPESPTRKWLDSLLEQMGLADRRSHRPSETIGAGSSRRVAIARRFARDEADDPLRRTSRRATSTRRRAGEILELMRTSTGRLRSDDHHGSRTRGAGRLAIADRILFIAERADRRASLGKHAEAGRGARGDELAQRMIPRRAGGGMARRKLRTALTANRDRSLGVALITGTPTSSPTSIKGAFGGIFTSVYRGNRRDGDRPSQRST